MAESPLPPRRSTLDDALDELHTDGTVDKAEVYKAALDDLTNDYRALKAENERLREALQEAIDTANGAYTAYANPNFKERAARWLTILG